jgi:hypothetical protein
LWGDLVHAIMLHDMWGHTAHGQMHAAPYCKHIYTYCSHGYRTRTQLTPLLVDCGLCSRCRAIEVRNCRFAGRRRQHSTAVLHATSTCRPATHLLRQVLHHGCHLLPYGGCDAGRTARQHRLHQVQPPARKHLPAKQHRSGAGGLAGGGLARGPLGRGDDRSGAGWSEWVGRLGISSGHVGRSDCSGAGGSEWVGAD